MSILTETEIDTLTTMARYWQEVSKREELHEPIMVNELGDVIRMLGAEKILLIITQYIQSVHDST